MACYGIMRILDITFHSDEEFNHMLIQNLRGMLSSQLDEWWGIDESYV